VRTSESSVELLILLPDPSGQLRNGINVLINSLAAICLAVVPTVASPQTINSDVENAITSVRSDSSVFSGRNGQLAVTVPRVQGPDIDIDGRLSEAVWAHAAVLSDFTQYEPVEGIPATERTEVRVFYSSDAIYFGLRAYDSEPELMFAHLVERDRSAFADDWIRIMLDTFDDQRQAYVFYVNPLGIQTDGLWIEGMQRRVAFSVSIDFNPDFVWESDGRVMPDGWVAEVKIPYTSLRFRQVPTQDWGIQVAREVRRTGFKQSWAPLTQDISNVLAQSGRLVGLQDLHPRRLLEINPVMTGKRVGQTVDDVYEQDSFEPDFGVNGRVGITQNLVLDATFNPDFSQVETDANQITVNERFALYFPEKRPFFLEGTEIFRTPRNLVHTRQIADPIGGAKLTGKLGPFNVGYLGALDEAPKTLYGGDDAAAFNLLRARGDVGDGSTIGVLYTDRSISGTGQFNRVLSGDIRFLFLRRYTLTTQVANSWTSAGNSEAICVAPLVAAELARSGRNFQFQARFDDVHNDFSTQSGFIRRVGDTELFGRIQGTRFGSPGAVLEQVTLGIQGNVFYNHDEFWDGRRPFEGELELHPALTFRGGRTLWFILRDGFFRFRPEDYATYQIEAANGDVRPFVVRGDLTHMLALGFIPRLRITGDLQVNGRMYFREVPIYAEGSRGVEIQTAPNVTVRLTKAAQLSLDYVYSRLWRTRDHTVFSTAHIPRTRLQYQFSKSFLVRAVVQYSLEERDALRDPTTERPILIGGVLQEASESGRFEGQFLLKYEPSPGTIFFIGYNRLMRGLANLRLSQMDLVGEGLFVKASYLLRR
jgi:hypothetical protein